MKKCIQDLVKNTSQVEIWIRISKVFIVSKRPEALFMTFTHLRNVESTSSIENIMILIFYKPSRMGADNRRQVPVIDTKHE